MSETRARPPGVIRNPRSSRRITQAGRLHKNPFLTVTHSNVDFGAFEKDYYVVDFGSRAAVIALDGDNVLMTWQYRFLIDDVSLELPGGSVGPDEGFDTAARRELLEETGYVSDELSHLVTFRPGLDNVENLTHLYQTKSVRQEQAFVSDPRESLAIEWVPLSRCVDLIFDKQITDGLTVLGVLACLADKAR